MPRPALPASVRIVRPLNVLLTFATVLLGGWLAVHTLTLPLVAAALSAALIAAAGYVQNDTVDLETDRISHPDRPLPQGRTSIRTARALTVFLYVGGLLVTAALPGPCTAVALGTALLLVAYNHGLKRRPLIGNLTVAVIGGVPFAYGGLAVRSPLPALLPAAFAASFHLAREILKDIQDRRGDRVTGGRTLPILIGETRAKLLFSLLAGALVAAIPLPAFLSLTGPRYLVPALALSALLILTVCLVWEAADDDDLETPSRLLKAGMVVGLAAFFLDALGS